MNPRVLDQLGSDELAGFFDSIAAGFSTIVQKSAPIVSAIGSGISNNASTIVGIGAAIANANTQKKLMEAQAKLATAQDATAAINAQVALQKAQINAAAAQTVVNGLNKGIIPPGATFAQAAQITVGEVVKTSGLDPNSPQGIQARQALTYAAEKENSKLPWIIGGGAFLLIGAGLLLSRTK